MPDIILKKTNLSFMPLLIIILLTVSFFLHLFYPQPKIIITPDFGLSDILHLHFSLKFHLSNALKNNKIPFLASNLAGGFPVFNQGEIGSLNIFNLLLFKFFDPVTAFNLNIVICFLLIGFFTYQYLKLIKLKSLPALFSSLSFSFSFYLITQISHYDILQGISLLPLMLFLLQKYFCKSKTKYLIFFSLALSQQIFAGFPQTVFISLLFLTFYFLYHSRGCLKSQPPVLPYFIFLTLGVGLSAIQLVPSKNFLAISNRKAGFAGNTATMFSYPPRHLSTLVKPFLLGNPARGTYPHFSDFNGSIFWENSGYFGLAALVFSLLSIIFVKKNKYIKFFWLTTFISFLLMTGKYSPLYFIFSFFPFNLFRAPSRFILIFVLSLSVLAGLFLNQLAKNFKKFPKLLTLFIISGLIINLVDLFKLGYSYQPAVPKLKVLSPPKTVQFLSKFKNNKIFVLETGKNWNNIFLDEGWQNPEKYIYFANSLQANINLLWQIPSFNAYEILTSQKYQLLNSLLSGQFTKPKDSKNWQVSEFGLKILKQNGINFIVSPEKITPAGGQENLQLVFQTQNQNDAFIFVYQIKNPLPFVRFASKVESANNLRDFIVKLNNSNLNLNTTIIASQKLPNFSPVNNNSQINLLEKDDQFIKFNVKLNQKAYLVIQQSHLPGWTAYLDGKKTQIYAVNLNQMAVSIPSGNHQLKFVYRPKGFLKGTVISLASLIVLLALVCFSLLFANKCPKNP